MAFIRNTDKFVEGSSNKFFTDGRAQLALQPTVTSLESEDSGMKLRLDVIEGGAGVSGSIAKAQADAQSYADQKIAALVNSAPEVLDTLKELSDAIGGDQNFAATVSGQIGAVDAKVDQEVLDRQAAISALQSSVSGDVSSLQSADSALSLRLDELELDPVTKSYVDSQDSSEASARQSGDNALSGRLNVLEADPVTKSYVDSEDGALDAKIGDTSIFDVSTSVTTTTTALNGEFNLHGSMLSQINQEIQNNWMMFGNSMPGPNIQGMFILTTDQQLPQPGASNVDYFGGSYLTIDGQSYPLMGVMQSSGEFVDMPPVGGVVLGGQDPSFDWEFNFMSPDMMTSIILKFQHNQVIVIRDQMGNQETLPISVTPNYAIFDAGTSTQSETTTTVTSQSLSEVVDGHKDRLDVLEGSGEGSVAKAEQDAKDYADSLDSAMDARMLVLEADPTTKSYVDSADSALQSNLDAEEAARIAAVSAEESARIAADGVLQSNLDAEESARIAADSGLQSQIDTEKGRIDAILLSADADKDSFAEIVQLINSVDTDNDSAFASYVLSNDAALAQEVSDRQSGDSALSGRLDVLEADPTTKSYVDSQDSSLQSQITTNATYINAVFLAANINSAANNKNVYVGFNKPASGTGTANTGIGAGSLDTLTSGADNTALGYNAGTALTSGSKNILLGVGAGDAIVTGSNNVIIGDLEGSSSLSDTMLFGSGNTERFRVDSSGKMGLGTQNPSQKLDVNGGMKFAGAFVSKSIHAQVGSSDVIEVSADDYYIGVDCSLASKTVQLPAPVAGKKIIVKDESGNAQSNNIMVEYPSGTIDGNASFSLTANYESACFISDGTNWFVI